MAYVVDRQGRLVAGAGSDYAFGQDMTNLGIVKKWVEQGVPTLAGTTTDEFTVQDGNNSVAMLGTYSPVATLEWAAVTQKKQQDAYQGVYEMQHNANLLALLLNVHHPGRVVVRCKAHHRTAGHARRHLARRNHRRRGRARVEIDTDLPGDV